MSYLFDSKSLSSRADAPEWGTSPVARGMSPTCDPAAPTVSWEKLVKTRRGMSGPRLAHDCGMKINLKLNKQRKIAFGALAAVAALAFWPEKDRPAAAPPEPAQVREQVAHIAIPARDAMPELARDPFSVEAPAPKLQRAAVAAAPAVPANPYRFVGELRVAGAVQRFLARGDDTFEAKAGDVLDDGYVVDSVSASAIVLVHRASGARQALAVGAPAWEDPARSRVMQAAQPGAAPATASAGVVPPLDALRGNLPQGYFVDVNGTPSANRS